MNTTEQNNCVYNMTIIYHFNHAIENMRVVHNNALLRLQDVMCSLLNAVFSTNKLCNSNLS